MASTSTGESPWFIVPADDKLNARLIVSQIVLNALDDLKMSLPEADKARRKELLGLRKLLAK